jgi:hypothetical protein
MLILVRGGGGAQVLVSAKTTNYSSGQVLSAPCALSMISLDVLLKNEWFDDALCNLGSNSSLKVAQEVYQPDGKVLLPQIPSDAKAEELRPMFRRLARNMGEYGTEGIKKFLETCGLQANSEVFKILATTFEIEPKVGWESKGHNVTNGNIRDADAGDSKRNIIWFLG